MDDFQDGRLSVYMEDVVRRQERLQKNESEEEETSKLLTKRKQEIWDEQYLNTTSTWKAARAGTRQDSSSRRSLGLVRKHPCSTILRLRSN